MAKAKKKAPVRKGKRSFKINIPFELSVNEKTKKLTIKRKAIKKVKAKPVVPENRKKPSPMKKTSKKKPKNAYLASFKF